MFGELEKLMLQDEEGESTSEDDAAMREEKKKREKWEAPRESEGSMQGT